MKNKIIGLTDYKGVFGQKWADEPYRSGMDKGKLKRYFAELGYDIEFRKLSEIIFDVNELKDNLFLYTSSEDVGYHYKDFIEDVVYGIQECGGIVIPDFKFLRANNNKVFMEILGKKYLNGIDTIGSRVYGSLEEVDFGDITYPIVFKFAKGSMSQGVSLAKNRAELESVIKKNCRSKNLAADFRDILRKIKRKGYIRESLYRNKFILQDFVPNLSFDYKVLVLGERYYIFQRPVREDDFRASGSGYKKYLYGSNVSYPEGIFDYSKLIFDKLNVPHLSLDIAYDGRKFYLFELQVVYFGTVGHHCSDGFYYNSDNKWIFKHEKLPFEKTYVDSIMLHLSDKTKHI